MIEPLIPAVASGIRGSSPARSQLPEGAGTLSISDSSVGAFGRFALQWLDEGWEVVPTRQGSKIAIVKGRHGYNRVPFDRDQVEFLIENDDYRNADLALPLADGIIGLDVDEYDSKTGFQTLKKYAAEHGLEWPLPRTIVITARDKPSGTRLFRVPPDLAWNRKPFGEDGGVEVISSGFYTMAPGSYHGKTGGTYMWYDQREGKDAKRHISVITAARRDALPELA